MRDMDRLTLSTGNDQIPKRFPHSENLSVRPRKKSLDNVVRGTVSTRVQQLQGFSNKISPKFRSRTRNHSREESSARFGRRVATHFSQPAHRNSKPNEEIHCDPTLSYAGISTPSASNKKQHSNLHDTIEQNSFESTNQEEILASKGREQNNKSKSRMNTPRTASHVAVVIRTSSDVNTSLKETDTSSSQKNSALYTPSTFLGLSSDDFHKFKSKEQAILQKKASDSTISTTSTLRRQSVRDLFVNHGIKRPTGLASSGGTYRTAKPNNQESCKYCRRCSWLNKGDSALCCNCNHHMFSHSKLAQNQDSSTIPKKEFENNRYDSQTKLFQQLDSATFIRKSQRSGPSPIHSNGTNPSKGLKSNFTNTSLLKPSDRLYTLGNPPETSEVKKNLETVKSVPFLTGRNVTTSVRSSPFLARDMTRSHEVLGFNSSSGVPSLNQSRPQATPKKLSYDTLQLNYTSSRNINSADMTLRNTFSKENQNHYILDPLDERILVDTYCHVNSTDPETNSLHEPLQSYSTELTLAEYIPNDMNLNAQNKMVIDKNHNETDERYLSTNEVSLKNGKETDSSTAHHQILKERSSWSQVEEVPTVLESTDGFGMLSRAKSVLRRGSSRLSRTGSTSSFHTRELDTNGKPVALFSSRSNKELTKRPKPSNLLYTEIVKDFSSESVIESSRADITPSHQSEVSLDQGKNTKNDNERKKMRRKSIAKKIKQGLSPNIERKKHFLQRQVSEPKLDNSNITGVITSGHSKHFMSDRWVELPPINPGDSQGLWKRSSDTSPVALAAQEIRGVTVTLQLEGRDDQVFKAKP